MRASSKHLRVESFGVVPPPPLSSIGDATVEEPVDPAADVPSHSILDVSDIRHMLETVMTVQAAHGQILVNMLDELHAL